VHAENLNYAAVAFIGTLSISLLWFYFPVWGAYRWFKGPYREVDVVVDLEGSVGGKGGKIDATEGPRGDLETPVDMPVVFNIK
jgi:hypothetical protein